MIFLVGDQRLGDSLVAARLLMVRTHWWWLFLSVFGALVSVASFVYWSLTPFAVLLVGASVVFHGEYRYWCWRVRSLEGVV